MWDNGGINTGWRTGIRFNNMLSNVGYSSQIFIWSIAERMCEIYNYYIIPFFHYINLVVDRMLVYAQAICLFE